MLKESVQACTARLKTLQAKHHPFVVWIQGIRSRACLESVVFCPITTYLSPAVVLGYDSLPVWHSGGSSSGSSSIAPCSQFGRGLRGSLATGDSDASILDPGASVARCCACSPHTCHMAGRRACWCGDSRTGVQEKASRTAGKASQCSTSVAAVNGEGQRVELTPLRSISCSQHIMQVTADHGTAYISQHSTSCHSTSQHAIGADHNIKQHTMSHDTDPISSHGVVSHHALGL